MSIHKKNNRKQKSKKPRRCKKRTKITRQYKMNVTPYEILLIWLETKYHISEIEFLFGSIEFVKQARIMIAREYISQAFCEHALPTLAI